MPVGAKFAPIRSLGPGGSMFDSLEEQMAKDENKVSSPRERAMRWLIYVIAAVLIFGGLIVGVRSLG